MTHKEKKEIKAKLKKTDKNNAQFLFFAPTTTNKMLNETYFYVQIRGFECFL